MDTVGTARTAESSARGRPAFRRGAGSPIRTPHGLLDDTARPYSPAAAATQFLLLLARHLHGLGPVDTARLAGRTLEVLTAAPGWPAAHWRC
ncbi:hypothetical protein [Streptomyces sp. NPDC127119]|uniref:hypothetical protein n=1 Tax=Streptomyces sp. NPDC127119 TaxID=3345370 RepID=UPI0036360927